MKELNEKKDIHDVKRKQVVKSKMGRDKNRFFVVMDVKNPYVYLADGKLRKLESLKKKKIMHIAVTSSFFCMDDDKITNKSLKRFLQPFNEPKII